MKNVHLGKIKKFEKISEFFFAKNFQVDITSSDLNEFLIGQKILEAETFLLNLIPLLWGVRQLSARLNESASLASFFSQISAKARIRAPAYFLESVNSP